jgi:cobalamin-dependent methionine synthase I
VNSISLKEEGGRVQAARADQAPTARRSSLMAFDEEKTGTTVEHKVNIAKRAHRILTKRSVSTKATSFSIPTF